jgi:hypothetical protein
MAEAFVRPSGLSVQRSLLLIGEQIFAAPEVGITIELGDSSAKKTFKWRSDPRVYEQPLALSDAEIVVAGVIGQRMVKATFEIIDGEGDETSIKVHRNYDEAYYDDDYARGILERFNAVYDHDHSRCGTILGVAAVKADVTALDYADIISSDD